MTLSSGGVLAIDTVGSSAINIGTQAAKTITTGSSSNTVSIEGSATLSEVTATSDRRLKENISKIANPIEIINKIKPKKYSFINDQQSKVKMGVIAQDLQSVLPDLVKGNVSEEYLSVDYTSFIGLLIAGMQEQQKTIEELKNEINNLKKLSLK